MACFRKTKKTDSCKMLLYNLVAGKTLYAKMLGFFNMREGVYESHR